MTAPCTKCGNDDPAKFVPIVEEVFLASRGGLIRHQAWQCVGCGRVVPLKEIRQPAGAQDAI